MQQFVYYGADNNARENVIFRDFPSTKFLITKIESDSSVKIEAIRKIIQDLTLTSQSLRVIYIPYASKLTLPAQNALLKTLEEPPSNTSFVLSVDNLSSLLPTICSRVIAIKVKGEGSQKNSEALALVKSALKLQAGERVQLADSLGKDRDICIAWLDSLISSLYQVMQETSKGTQLQMLARLAELAVSTRTDLASNVNVALTIQSFFLSLPKSK